MAGTGLKLSWITQLDGVYEDDLEVLGQHRYEDGVWYKWVRYHHGTSTPVVPADMKRFVGYHTPSGYRTNVVTMDTSVANNRTAPAGLLISEPPHDYYHWIQISGSTIVVSSINNAGSDGQQVKLDNVDGEITVVTAATDVPVGFLSFAAGNHVVLTCPW